MIENKLYEDILDLLRETKLNFFMFSEGECDIPSEITNTYENRRELFLWFLKRLLDEKQIRIAKNRIFLPGSSDEIVQLFREKMPKNEDEFENGIWFYSNECPGASVWILDYPLGDLTEPIGDGKYYLWT